MTNPKDMKGYSLQIGQRVAYQGNVAIVEMIGNAPASASSPLSNYPILIKIEDTDELIKCQDNHVQVMFGGSVLG